MIIKRTVYITYCDGCNKQLINEYPSFYGLKEYQNTEQDAEYILEKNGWVTEKVDWRVRHYCPECQKVVQQLISSGKYNRVDGYHKDRFE